MGRESGIILQVICDRCGSGHAESLGVLLPPDTEQRAERARTAPCAQCGSVGGDRRVTIRFGTMWAAPVYAD